MADGQLRGRNDLKSDWKVFLTLDRDAVREEIQRLQALLEKPWNEIYCIVDAEDEQDAELTAKEFTRIRPEFVKYTRAHKLPT